VVRPVVKTGSFT